MRRLFFIHSILIFITACAPSMDRSFVPQKLGQLSVGMTKPEVLNIMEISPTQSKAYLNTEYLIYKTHWSDYFVRFVDGKVNAYGEVGDFDSTKDPAFNINIKNK